MFSAYFQRKDNSHRTLGVEIHTNINTARAATSQGVGMICFTRQIPHLTYEIVILKIKKMGSIDWLLYPVPIPVLTFVTFYGRERAEKYPNGISLCSHIRFRTCTSCTQESSQDAFEVVLLSSSIRSCVSIVLCKIMTQFISLFKLKQCSVKIKYNNKLEQSCLQKQNGASLSVQNNSFPWVFAAAQQPMGIESRNSTSILTCSYEDLSD